MQLEGRDAKISDGIYDERMVQVRCSFSSEFTFCRNLLPYRLRPRVRRLSCVYQFQSTPAELFECERAREKIRSQESSEIIAGWKRYGLECDIKALKSKINRTQLGMFNEWMRDDVEEELTRH